jgi:hypothetical protein
MGALLTMLAGTALLLSFFAIGTKKYHDVPRYLPRLANKTAFISAACQRPDGDEDAYMFPITLMAVELNPERDSGAQPLEAEGETKAVRRIVFSTDRYAEPPGHNLGGEELFEQPLPITNRCDEWDTLVRSCSWQQLQRLLKVRRVKEAEYSRAD